MLTAINQIFAEQGVNIAAQYLQTNSQMGYVVIDIEADDDVAEKALLSMKAIPRDDSRASALLMVRSVVSGGADASPDLQCWLCRRVRRSRHRQYQTQILLGVTTAGNGTSHFSTGNASTPWQSCA